MKNKNKNKIFISKSLESISLLDFKGNGITLDGFNIVTLKFGKVKKLDNVRAYFNDNPSDFGISDCYTCSSVFLVLDLSKIDKETRQNIADFRKTVGIGIIMKNGTKEYYSVPTSRIYPVKDVNVSQVTKITGKYAKIFIGELDDGNDS